MLFPMLCMGQVNVYQFYTYENTINGVPDTIDVEMKWFDKMECVRMNIGLKQVPNSEYNFCFKEHHAQYDVYESDLNSLWLLVVYTNEYGRITMFDFMQVPHKSNDFVSDHSQYYKL